MMKSRLERLLQRLIGLCPMMAGLAIALIAILAVPSYAAPDWPDRLPTDQELANAAQEAAARDSWVEHGNIDMPGQPGSGNDGSVRKKTLSVARILKVHNPELMNDPREVNNIHVEASDALVLFKDVYESSGPSTVGAPYRESWCLYMLKYEASKGFSFVQIVPTFQTARIVTSFKSSPSDETLLSSISAFLASYYDNTAMATGLPYDSSERAWGFAAPRGGDPGELPQWVIVAGGAAAVAAAAAAIKKALEAAAKAKKPAKKDDREPPEKKEKKKKQKHYILQLSSQSLEVANEKPASLRVAAWEVDESGSYMPAGSASLRITVPPQASFLRVSPASGTGSLDASVALAETPGENAVELTVTGSAGNVTTQASVKVTIKAECEMEFF
ncbi:MAG: hypothetical protein RDV48_01225 [Candidatus Eremiobacteraeota bacterium]|nr:hypothetical protein [Candidatus Eremiobacteraeota bacterium]